MATDDTHIIRVLLEGRDNLSGVLKKANKDFDKDLKSLKKTALDFDKTLKGIKPDESLFGGSSGRYKGQAFNIDKVRQQIAGLNKELNNRGARGFFSQLTQGMKETQIQAEKLKAALGQDKDTVKARVAAYDAETRLGQIKINQDKKASKDDLARRLANIDKTYKHENDLAKQLIRDQQDARAKLVQKRVDEIKYESKLRQDARVLEAKTRPGTGIIALQDQKKNATTEQKQALTQSVAIEKAITAAQNKADKDTTTQRVNRLQGFLTDKKTMEDKALREAIDNERVQFRQQVKDEQFDLTQKNAGIQQKYSDARTAGLAVVKSGNTSQVKQDAADAREAANAAHEADSAFQKAGRSVGLWAGDLKRGFDEGRTGVADFSKEAQSAETRMARFGQTIGRAVGSLGTMINLRWFFLTSIVQTLGTLIVNLGAALISVGSAAAAAGVALGSGLVAGVSQALPVVGLLAAAFSRVQTVIKAVQQYNSNKVATAAESVQQQAALRTSTEQLADAQYALQQAYIAVGEAQYQIGQSGQALVTALQQNKEAILNLANTRRDVSRGLVDAANAETDAQLALRDAELGVVDAKRQLIAIEKEQKENQEDINAAKGAVREAEQRLAAAKKVNDKAGIADAQATLSVAKSSLSQIYITARTTNTAVKEAQLGVAQAAQRRKEAQIDAKRSEEDNKRIQKQGVTGNQQFIAAQREVRASVLAIADARHQQVLSVRAVKDAEHEAAIQERTLRDIEHDRKSGLVGQISGQLQLKALLEQLTPAEKKLYDSLLGLQAAYKKVFRPITDIIVGSISTAVDRVSKLFKDKKLVGAATVLADSIGKAIGSISKFATSPKISKDFQTFITNAAKNMPLVVDSFKKLSDIIIILAKNGQPIFRDFLEFVDHTLTKLDKFLSGKKGATFLGMSDADLKSFEGLFKSIGRILLALFNDSAPAGKGIVDSLTKFFNSLADWLDKHPKEVQKFFEDSAKNLGKIAKAAAELAPVLFKAFTSKSAANFVVFLIKVIIPGLLLMTTTIQKVSAALLAITHIPILGQFVKYAIEIAIAEKAMNKVFPVTQKVTNIVKALVKETISGVGPIIKFFKVFKNIVEMQKFVGIMQAIEYAAPGLGTALDLAFGPVGIAIAAVTALGAAIYLLNEKFHFIGPTLHFMKVALIDVFDWVKDHWKLLAALFLGPLGLMIDAVTTHWKWIKDHTVDLFANLERYFTKFGKWVVNFGVTFAQDTYNWLIKPWLDIAKFFLSIDEWIWDNIFNPVLKAVGINLGSGSKIYNGIYNGFLLAWNDLAKWFSGIGTWLQKNFIQPILDFFGIHSPSKLMYDIGTDIVNGLVKALEKLPGLVGNIFKSVVKSINNELKKVPGVSGLEHAFGLDGGNKVSTTQIAQNLLAGKKQGLLQGPANEIVKALGNPTNAQNHAVLKTIDPATLKTLKARYKKYGPTLHKAHGGVIYAAGGADDTVFRPSGTDTVPAMLTPGEIVLNKLQQSELAAHFGTGIKGLQTLIFGNRGAINAGIPKYGFNLTTTGGKLNSNYQAFGGPNFQLTPHKDDQGNTVWFAEFKDGTYGQVSLLDANRILGSNGRYLPNYLKRVAARHKGLHLGTLKNVAAKAHAPVINTGQVRRNTRGFATGGVVTNTPAGKMGGNQLHQHFNIKTEGETDWHYVMRIGAQHAQEGY